MENTNEHYRVVVTAYSEDAHKPGDDGIITQAVIVEAPTEEHAGIKACAVFVDENRRSYGVRVSSIRTVD